MIGIDIGADTPEGIAIAIIAEIQAEVKAYLLLLFSTFCRNESLPLLGLQKLLHIASDRCKL